MKKRQMNLEQRSVPSIYDIVTLFPVGWNNQTTNNREIYILRSAIELSSSIFLV